jgi:hypothetical protein
MLMVRHFSRACIVAARFAGGNTLAPLDSFLVSSPAVRA